MDDIGLEQLPKTREKLSVAEFLTQNPTHSLLEQRLIEAFRRMKPDDQARLIEQAENVASPSASRP